MECDDCSVLLREYAAATVTFRRSIQDLMATVGTADFDAAMRIAEKARICCEKLRSELNRQRADHDTGGSGGRI
jgi:hypothetical protein